MEIDVIGWMVLNGIEVKAFTMDLTGCDSLEDVQERAIQFVREKSIKNITRVEYIVRYDGAPGA